MASRARHEQARSEASAALRARGIPDELCVRQFLQTIAFGETSYGYGWTGDGVGSNNMGAIQRGRPPCGPDAFSHGDTHEDGSGYGACFAVYPSRAAGWEALAFELFIKRPKVLAAARACDFDRAVAEMRASGYFELALSQYQATVRRNVAEIASALGEVNPVPKVDAGGSSAAVWPWSVLLPTISRGARGNEAVKAWQTFIGVLSDGIFGAKTENATIVWQSRNGLTADGIVGPQTWKEAICHSPEDTPRVV